MIPEITPSILYIGCDDADLDLFESQYRLVDGMCYNSYLVVDEKIAIMDTVDPRRTEAWKQNLTTALAGRQPDYLVVQHVEPDHAGAIADTMEAYPSLTLVASAKAIAFIQQFNEKLDLSNRTLPVSDGSTLCLGGRTLTFATAPMVHWPEVIVTYDDGDKVLFSADAFGRFGIYGSTLPWDEEARRYYFGVCGKYGMQVSKLLEKAAAMDIKTICALHGNILRGEEMAHALSLYQLWAKYTPEQPESIVVAHASIHGGTAEAAERFAQLLRDKGAPEVVVHDLCRGSHDHAMSDAFRCGKLVLAAASYDSEVFPPMHHFLHKLRLKGFQKRRVAIIENGTWAPTAAKMITAELEAFKNLEMVQPAITIKSRLKTTDADALNTLADAVLA